MSRRFSLLTLGLCALSALIANPASAQLSNLGVTTVASGQLSVTHGVAYAARHDVYLMVYESPSGVQGRFVSANGGTVGNAFMIASLSGVAYVNKPMVAYSNDSPDDVFFVAFATDRGKQYDGPPSVYMQKVTFTGTGGALQGGPFLASDGVYELPNDLIFNPFTRQFVAVWERTFSSGPDVMVRYFNVDGSAAIPIVNVSNGNWSQGAAKAAVDWQTNRIMIGYQGVHPLSPPSPEQLGTWAKIVDGSTGALLTGLLTVTSGFTIEVVPVFVPERNGFIVAWTGFTGNGRDVQGRFVSSANGSVGSMPANVFTISGSGRQEGAAMGMYDAVSRRVLMGVQSSGGCPNDSCPYLDGALLDGQGTPLSSFTGLSTVTPKTNGGGTFYPDVAVGENGRLGVSYVVDYISDHVERVSLPAAATPGPTFDGGGSPPAANNVGVSPTSLSFSVTKNGSAISGFSPQTVTVSFSSSPVAWTAATSTAWLQVSNGAGSGNGSFTVTVINPSDVIGSSTSLNGSVVLTAPGAPNSPVTIPVSATIIAQGGTITPLGRTAVASGQLTVIDSIAYSAKSDVYLTVYESPSGVQGRFVNTSGATVGNAFTIAGLSGISYANKPRVEYSNDSPDDVFFVIYGTDRGKQFDGPPSVYIQRVTFTGTGGALQGGPILASEGVYEYVNDIVFNPVTRKFVLVWERVFSEGPDVMMRFFNVDGTPASSIVNISNGNWSQGAAKAAVDWETNRIMIAYQGVHPLSPPTPEVLGTWAKIVDGSNGTILTGLLTVASGFTIEVVPVFLPERDGFMVAWTGFTGNGRDIQARFVSSATGTVGTMPAGTYTISGTSRQEGNAIGMYDSKSRRVLMAVQSSGGCPNDACPYLDGAILDAQGTPLTVFTGLSTATPKTSGGGTFYPDMAVGENGQFGFSYVVDYIADYVERVSLPVASQPGPGFTPETSIALSAGSVSFSIQKTGSTISGFSPKTIGVSFTDSPLAWTASTSTPWLQVTNGSGSGSGGFSVTVINPGNVIGSQTSLSGNVVITAAGATNSPVTLPVTLTVVSSNLVFLNDDSLGDVLAYDSPTGGWARILTTANGGSVENSGTWIVGSTIKSARFNADALADFFLFSPTTGQWMKILSQGTNFTVQATGTWWPGWQVYPTDLDGDGLTDMFLYDPATGTWFRAISTPTGFTYHQGGWNPGWEIATVKLNGDTYGDLFLINRTTGRWFWVVGDGSGFTYPVTGTWWPNWAIYPGDFNGDGVTDLLLYSPNAGQYFVATTGAAGFTYTSEFWSPGWSLTVADLDGDGADDVFLHHAPTGKWTEMISNKAGGFANAGGQAWTLGWTIYPTDLNGDGRADFVLYNPATGEWVQAKNLALGSFNYTGGFLTPGLTLVLGLPKG